MRGHIELYWRELAEVTRKMPYAVIAAAADMLLECQRRGSTIFVLGNGGSAATASHFACDLAKGTRINGAPTFRVMPLTDNVPLMTAWGNDTSYDRVFAEQLTALVRPGDVVVMISASGNSPNVLRAAEVARDAHALTIAMTGQSGGKLRCLSDLTMRVPSPSIELVEDAHMVIAHSLCVALRERLRAEMQARVSEVGVLHAPAGEPAVVEVGA
ncbi:MAG: SIS domain-containing protein [Chloroflexota bacterium]|nr:SIS domain-containing protein [Chloroflexota bacterium]